MSEVSRLCSTDSHHPRVPLWGEVRSRSKGDAVEVVTFFRLYGKKVGRESRDSPRPNAERNADKAEADRYQEIRKHPRHKRTRRDEMVN